MHIGADNRQDFVQYSGRVHGSGGELFLAKLLIAKSHECSLFALTNCYLYQIRGDTSDTDEQGHFHFDGYQIKSRAPNYMFGAPKVSQQILTVVNEKEYRLWEARLPTNGTTSLKMVEEQLKYIDASLTKDMQDTQYEYHCPESPRLPLLVVSSLNIKGFSFSKRILDDE